MLVISCPCALVISVPLGYFGGVGGTSRHGILVKGATFLDALARVHTVVFDKTGTMTQGRIQGHGGEPPQRRGRAASPALRRPGGSALEPSHRRLHQGSVRRNRRGPRLRAAVGGLPRGGRAGRHGPGGRPRRDGRQRQAAAPLEIPHDTCCVDGTAVHVAVDGTYAGLPRPLATRPGTARAQASRTCAHRGVQRTALLTGDGSDVARRVAAELGIDEWHGGPAPRGKGGATWNGSWRTTAAAGQRLSSGTGSTTRRCLRARMWGSPWAGRARTPRWRPRTWFS